ncbi:MAG: hypothetical protein KF775_13885 [Cyclobacteriaceae bacterium]|nr:hypothetical protein [Cyclobacteriaceae bacterium]
MEKTLYLWTQPEALERGTTIFYKKNGTVFYTSLIPSTTSLVADFSFAHPGGRLLEVTTHFSGLSETPIYGSSRLGQHTGGQAAGTLRLGLRQYELTNHLGNVLAVVTDNIRMIPDSTWAQVVQTNDYYAFGSSMPGRNFSSANYRYGFNGKEKDDNGEFGNATYDYGFRIYNPSIGRFLSEDPLTSKYPELTPYQFASNTPIWAIDVDGLEAHVLSGSQEKGFNLSYDWNAKPLEQGQVYFNGSAANVSDLSSQYEIPFFNPTSYPEGKLGDPNYYQWRNDDYNVRAGLAGDKTPAPEYYLGYGDKYIKRFTYETSRELSGQGNEWLGKARYNLQALMEKGLNSDPMMERNNSAFQKFAFESHVPAYVDAGVLGLDFLDKTHTLTTPDAKDLLSDLGRQQAQAVMKLQVKYYVDNPGTAAVHAAKLTYQWPLIQRALEKKAAKELLKDLYPTSLKTP